MTMQNYRSTVRANIAAKDAFSKIADVSEWWSKGMAGTATAVGDSFKIDWGQAWVCMEVVEAVPGKRSTWHVTDCHLHWLKDMKEWKDTRIVWDLAESNGSTEITLTHLGLTPEIECFDACQAGWDFYFGKSLLKLCTDGSGLADRMGASDA